MKAFHYSIAGMMIIIFVIAIVSAALKYATELWASVAFFLTFGMLLFSLIGVAFRQGNQRLFWAGFAVFGFGYFILAISTGALGRPHLLTTTFIEFLYGKIGPSQTITSDKSTLQVTGMVMFSTTTPASGALPFFQIGHSIATLLIALLGTFLVRAFRQQED